MSLVEINWHPNQKQLRSFGLIALIASAIISLLLYLLKGLAIHWAIIIFVAGFIIFLSSRFSLRLTKVFYLAITAATMPIGFVVSFILLAGSYFILLMPLGLLFRLIGRDSLNRRFDPTADSYWIAHRPPEDIDRYFQQF